MGSLQAQEMSWRGDMGLLWHLQSNHYPPLPASLLPVAKRAIHWARRGKWNSLVMLPKGTLYKGTNKAPVFACIRAWHLDAWVNR